MRKPIFSTILLVCCGVLALGLAALLIFNPITSDSYSELMQFVGRFHPVVLHLPIGMFCLLALMEVLVAFKVAPSLKPATGLVLVVAIVTTLFAVLTGFLLAYGGGSAEPLVMSHMKNGVLLGIASLALGALKLFDARKLALTSYKVVLVLSMVLLGFACHEGGSITHGRDYLTKYMPNAIRPIFGIELIEEEVFLSRDELIVFEHLIQPVVEQSCLSCHNPDKLKGELNFETYEGYLAGGELAPSVVPHDLDESELYYRITLPQDDDEFMPPDEKPPLSSEEVALFEWWIENGASKDAKVSEMSETSPELEAYISGVMEKMLSPEKRKELEEEQAKLYDALGELKKSVGVFIQPIASDSSQFAVLTHSISGDFGDGQLAKIAPYAENVVDADFSRTQLSDRSVDTLLKFTNLKSLNLNNTKLTGANLGKLAALENLETLNLYGSAIAKERLSELAKLTQLKKLYLYQTDLYDPLLLDQLRESLPDCELL